MTAYQEHPDAEATDEWASAYEGEVIDIVPKAIAVAQARAAEAMLTSHEHGDEKRQLAIAVVSASRSVDAPVST
jgi:hypothetical protein